MVDKSFDLIGKEDRAEAIEKLIGFFESERGERIGVIAAEAILDDVLLGIGTKIYNKAVKECLDKLKVKTESAFLETEVDLLKA